MPTADFEGKGVHYTDHGDGPAVVMLHAGASSGRQWRRVAEALPELRIVAPDALGLGLTPAWTGPVPLTHDLQAASVLAVMAAAALERAHIVGHSYGGATALRLVEVAPARVASLILVEPICMPLLADAGETAMFEAYRRFAQGFIDSALAGDADGAWRTFLDVRNGNGTWDGMDDKGRAHFLAITVQSVAGFQSNLAHATTVVGCRAIAVPTVAVYGENTTAPERRVTQVVAANVPDCAVHVIPGAGHMSPLTHAAEVAAIIRDHIATASQ